MYFTHEPMTTHIDGQNYSEILKSPDTFDKSFSSENDNQDDAENEIYGNFAGDQGGFYGDSYDDFNVAVEDMSNCMIYCILYKGLFLISFQHNVAHRHKKCHQTQSLTDITVMIIDVKVNYINIFAQLITSHQNNCRIGICLLSSCINIGFNALQMIKTRKNGSCIIQR